MNAQVTATVELLTAEVRVLTVGARQITASVAKQLDQVGWHEAEPFGRVRLGDGRCVAIGRRRGAGDLVLITEIPLFEAVCDETTGFLRKFRPTPVGQAYDALPLIVLAGLR